MEAMSNNTEQEHKRRGRTVAIAVHVGLLLLALYPFLKYPDPPPGQEGIMVNLGLPDVGQGDENAAAAEPSEAEEAEPEVEVEEEVVEEEAEPEETKAVEEPEPVEEKKVIETEDPNALALKRKKEKEAAKKKAEEEAEKKRKAAEAKKKAEAEAKKKADAKRKADAKDFGKSLGLDGLGKGKGNTGKDGNQGDPNGDPNASRLEGISTGAGNVGGGLSARGVRRSPKVSENSQKSGRIVLNVCVDQNGKVTSAEYTQKGSSTADAQLRAAAIRNAKSWQFSKGALDKQCGTITYNFKVK